MEWRPYADTFVSNTFREYVAKHDFQSFPRARNPLDLLTFKPSPRDVEIQQERLAHLQHKVAQQRARIKLHDLRLKALPTHTNREIPVKLLPKTRRRDSIVEQKEGLFTLTAIQGGNRQATHRRLNSQ